ncbi:hypothetical protein PsorP6_013452 [Peronosclerospora sorghi]|uniref:Uncharacterized protein n=1 Tax=Peronosclerospora sorghi TaxID=230839 RepID=A0ACC0VIE9_9STRA|nr:hypothetical protein PsorP6_013452 [Peronosclerospora sorghi]
MLDILGLVYITESLTVLVSYVDDDCRSLYRILAIRAAERAYAKRVQLAQENLKLVREELAACYREHGLNHRFACKKLREEYAKLIQDPTHGAGYPKSVDGGIRELRAPYEQHFFEVVTSLRQNHDTFVGDVHAPRQAHAFQLLTVHSEKTHATICDQRTVRQVQSAQAPARAHKRFDAIVRDLAAAAKLHVLEQSAVFREREERGIGNAILAQVNDPKSATHGVKAVPLIRRLRRERTVRDVHKGQIQSLQLGHGAKQQVDGVVMNMLHTVNTSEDTTLVSRLLHPTLCVIVTHTLQPEKLMSASDRQALIKKSTRFFVTWEQRAKLTLCSDVHACKA